ncbi:MAG: hypothetical protein V2A34_03475 [Lentisphaerota bacterium]
MIAFSGVVSRAENKELLRHYHYKWRFLHQLRVPKKKMPCIFVDTAPWSGNVTVPSFAKPMAVIDHHVFKRRHREKWLDLVADVRSGTGASASILYEYLMVCGITVPRWLATIMTYAIATETRDFSEHVTDLDLRAYHDLMPRANASILGDIRHAPLPRTYYAQLREAMQNAMVFGRVAWSHLKEVDKPEIVPEIAELLLRAERITWSFCTAWQQDSLLISLRSDRRGAHCGSLLRSLIRKGGSAGGHDHMAAGFLDLKGLPIDQREEKRKALIHGLVSRIEKRTVQPLENPEPLVRDRYAEVMT